MGRQRLRVKIEVPNRGKRLRSGMFATVRFHPSASLQALTVPSRAVLRTGQRNVVVLDLGGGRFAPREITLGHQVGGVVEVLDGLAEGERVVTSAQFLLDSEASLQEAVQKMIAQGRAEAAAATEHGGAELEGAEHEGTMPPDQQGDAEEHEHAQ